MAEEIHTGHSPDLDNALEHGMNLHKRQSRVTVKYNRKQLQKRLDVEKWIDEGLDKLYEGKVSDHTASSQVMLVQSSRWKLQVDFLWEKNDFNGEINYSAVSMYFQMLWRRMLCHTLFWNVWLQKCATVPSLRSWPQTFIHVTLEIRFNTHIHLLFSSVNSW